MSTRVCRVWCLAPLHAWGLHGGTLAAVLWWCPWKDNCIQRWQCVPQAIYLSAKKLLWSFLLLVFTLLTKCTRVFQGRIQCWDIITSPPKLFTASETEKTFLFSIQLLRSEDDSRSLKYVTIFLVTQWDLHSGLMPWRTVCGNTSLCWHYRGWHFRSTNVFGMVESGREHLSFWQIKVLEWRTLTKKERSGSKFKETLCFYQNPHPDCFNHSQFNVSAKPKSKGRKGLNFTVGACLPFLMGRRLGWGLQGPFCEIIKQKIRLCSLHRFQPITRWWPSTALSFQNGEYFISVWGIILSRTR